MWDKKMILEDRSLIKYDSHNIVVNYNENIGAVYNVSTCQLIKVTPNMAKLIKEQSINKKI